MIDYDLAYKIVSYPLGRTSSTIKIVLGIHNVLVFQKVSHHLLCQNNTPFKFLIRLHYPSLRIESFAIINLRGVSTKLNKYNTPFIIPLSILHNYSFVTLDIHVIFE